MKALLLVHILDILASKPIASESKKDQTTLVHVWGVKIGPNDQSLLKANAAFS